MDTAFIDLKREAIPGEDDHSARRHKLCQELNGFIEVTEGVSIVSDPQYEGGGPPCEEHQGWVEHERDALRGIGRTLDA